MIKGGAYAIGLSVLALTTVIGVLDLPWEQFPPGMYEASDQSPRHHTVAAGDEVWLQTNDGDLWRIRRSAKDAVNVATPEEVKNLCIQAARPVIVTAPPGRAPTWTLRRWTGSGWTMLARIASRGEGLAGIACEPEDLIVLTSRRLITIRGPEQTVVPLSQRVPAGVEGAFLATPTKVYLGVNVGEFGGGLMSVDRRTGETRSIVSNETGEVCGGPLNRDCDDVTGLVVDPWKPGCVDVAIGIVFNKHGRVVEVCDGRVRRLFFTPCKDDPENVPRPPDPEPPCTEALFGLVRRGDRLLTVGADGLHLIDSRGTAENRPLPAFTRYGPFVVSFDDSGYIIVDRYSDDPALALVEPEIVAR